MHDDGVIIPRADDESRFRTARPGDHLLIPFQCELCHFRNLKGRDPNSLDQDKELLAYIRRANLDAFWSREPGTVSNNLSLLKRTGKTASKFGLEECFPTMGPYPLKDVAGMFEAVAVLDKSLDVGRHDVHVQWGTFRKVRGAMSNLWHATPGGVEERIGAYEKSKTWITNSPTYSLWFTRFMEGVHRRVGEIVKQDEPISIEVVHAVDKILEQKWRAEKAGRRRLGVLLDISRMVMWFVVGFCTGLRGEEMLLIKFWGTYDSLEKLDSPPQNLPPFFCVIVTGPTKGQRLSGAKFGIPCIGKTQGTQLRPGKWAKRHLHHLKSMGQDSGYVFKKAAKTTKLLEFEDEFLSLLEEVQSSTTCINPGMDVRDCFGIYRSLRRGVTAHARNMGVSPDLVSAINRWRNDGNLGSLSMLDMYSQLDAITPTLIRYSQSL